MKKLISSLSILGLFTAFAFAGNAYAVTDCTFSTSGTTMTLDADCTTDATVTIPDGMTLDGSGNTITAVDPISGHFVGAVVKDGGTSANVTRLNITTSGLANVCDAGDDRLRGIMFEGASGSITHSTVDGINQGASGCQEGNAIEVRNAPFDGSGTADLQVEIAHNTVTDYQKTGILANGDVDVNIHHNNVGGSATQANLAANAVQLGFGALGSVTQNQIDGNSWHTDSAAATAVLVYEANNVTVSNNNIGGNADLGIYFFGDNGIVDNNRVFENGVDGYYDIGIGNYGADNSVTNNKVRGYEIAYEGVADGNNKTIPSPQSN